MARIRPRRHDALLRIAPARIGLHQIEPTEDHRRGHRLALPERTETRIEGMTMDRRHFMGGIAGAVGGPLLRPVSISAAEVAPETTAVTLAKTPALCTAPQFIAEELLRAEGFTEIRYVETIAPDVPSAVAAGKVDFSMAYTSQFVAAVDTGEPVTLLGGIMVGCFELFGGDNVRSIGDLKGKTVGVQAIGSQPHTLVALMAAQVGLDPKTDFHFVSVRVRSAMFWSTPRSTGHGRSITAVCWPAIASSCANTLSR